MSEVHGARRGRPRHTAPERIQRVAIELFLCKGFAATSIDEIAAAAGIGRSTFFGYFDGKTSVIWLDYALTQDRLAEALARHDGRVPLLSALKEALIDSMSANLDDRDLHDRRNALLLADPQLRAQGIASHSRIVTVMNEYLRRNAEFSDAVAPEVISYAILGALAGSVRVWGAVPGSELRAVLRPSLELVVATMEATFPCRQRHTTTQQSLQIDS